MSGDQSSGDAVRGAGVDPPAIRADGLTKVYDGPEGELRAVDDVSFAVDSGTVVGVLGPNGAGKTTLIKSILGLVIPTSGTAEIDGIDVHDNPNEAYERAGAMLEGARNIYWRLTVRENLEFFASLVGHSPNSVRDRHDELLDRFDLLEKADEPVKELSRGMKQKVSLASTLSRGGSVLFLDEPTLGLDVESSVELRRELRDLVTDGSMTVVLSSHDMDVIEELCDRVIIMNDGRIIADDTVENLTGVFSSQAYEVTMNGTLPERSRRTIEREHAVERWERTADGATQFEVVLENGAALYDLVGTLEASGIAVASLDAIQPDLESAFLEITNDDRAATSDADGATAGDSTADTDGAATESPTPEPDGGQTGGGGDDARLGGDGA
jgi:ABC-2 type transport system ATP-binding protein